MFYPSIGLLLLLYYIAEVSTSMVLVLYCMQKVSIAHHCSTGPELTKESVVILDEAVLTRRINMSLTMSLYDPLGFISPLTIRLKWHLQQLGKDGQKAGWDEALSSEQREPWLEILKLMVEQESISINRSCKPEDVDLLKKVILVCYMDGSNAAKAFCGLH